MNLFTLYQILQIVLGFYWWMLLGQGVLFLFTGYHSENNFVFQLLRKINYPVTHLTRILAPAVIVDRHIGMLAFALVTVARIAVHIVFFRMGALPDMSAVG